MTTSPAVVSPPKHNIRDEHPNCDKLGLKKITVPSGEYAGYDQEEAEKLLGGRFVAFQSWLMSSGSKCMFTCGHRTKTIEVGEAASPTSLQVEALCYYANDIEAFLAGGN